MIYTDFYFNYLDYSFYNTYIPFYEVIPNFIPFNSSHKLDFFSFNLLLICNFLFIIINYLYSLFYFLPYDFYISLDDIYFNFIYFIYEFYNHNTYKNTFLFYYYSVNIILFDIFFFFIIKLIIELHFRVIYSIYLANIIKNKFFLGFTEDYSYLPCYISKSMKPPINMFTFFFFYWLKQQKKFQEFKNNCIIFYSRYIVVFNKIMSSKYKNNPNFFTLTSPYWFFKYRAFQFILSTLKEIHNKRNNIIDEKFFFKSYNSFLDIFLFKSTYFLLTNYSFLFIRFFIKQIIILSLFFISFIIKYYLYIILKTLINISYLNKFLYAFIFYIVNIYIYIGLLFNYVYYNHLLGWYINLKSFLLYYLNMFLHYEIYSRFTKLIFLRSFYDNCDMLEYFPLYQSKFILFFFSWLKPIKNAYKVSFKKLLIIFYLLFITLFIKFVYFLTNTIFYSIKYFYYIFIFQMNVIHKLFKNKNNIFINLFYIYIFIVLVINPIYFLFILLLLLLYTICSYIYNLLHLNLINKFIFFIGYIFFLFLDTLYIINKILFKYFFFLLKYIFYPFILFILMLFWSNNPLIWLLYLKILKIFLFFFYVIFFNILKVIWNFYILANTYDPNIFSDILNNWKTIYNLIHNKYMSLTFYDSYSLGERFSNDIITGDQWKWHFIKWCNYMVKFGIINLPVTIKYRFYMFIFYIHSKLPILYLRDTISFTFYIIHIFNILFITYKSYIYYYLCYFIFYYIPFTKLQPNIDLITYYYGYYLLFIRFFNSFFIIYTIKLIPFFIKWILILYIPHIIFKWYLVFYYAFYNMYTYIISYIYNLPYLIYNIYYFFFIDFLHFIYLKQFCRNLILYTNLDFCYFKNENNLINNKYSLFSWFSISSNDLLSLNRKKISFSLFYDRELMWWRETFWLQKTINKGSLFYYNTNNNIHTFWLYKYFYYIKKTKILYLFYKINYCKKFFKIFPFITVTYILYTIPFYFLISFIIIYLYNKIYIQVDDIFLYVNNRYIWDILRNDICKNNNQFYINNTAFNRYFYYNIISHIVDLSQRTVMLDEEADDDGSFYKNTDFINNFLKPYINKETLRLYYLKKEKDSKFNYTKILKRYHMLKTTIVTKVYTKLSKSLKKKIKTKLYFLYYFNYRTNKINKFQDFIDIISFNFRNLFFTKKYYQITNYYWDSYNPLNQFLSFFNYKNIYIPLVSSFYFEEDHIEGPAVFYMNDSDYFYLEDNINNIYDYSKWLSNLFKGYRCSNYFLHKDPTMCFVAKDNHNVKHYFNNCIESKIDDFFKDLILIIIPVLFIYTYICFLLNFAHDDTHGLAVIYGVQITYYICFLLSQFEFFQDTYLKFWWLTFEQRINALPFYDEFISSNLPWCGLFSYNKVESTINPLYTYYKREIYFSVYSSFDTTHSYYPLVLIDVFYGIFYWNLLYFYNIVYIKYISFFDFYSYKLIFLFIIKILLLLFIFLFIKFKSNPPIINFFLFNKFSINILKYSFTIKNLYSKNINNLNIIKNLNNRL